MAEEATLQGLVDRMKREGELVRNDGVHSIRSVKEVMMESTNLLVDAITNIGSEVAQSIPPLIEEQDDGRDDAKEKEDQREDRNLIEQLKDTMDGIGKSLQDVSDNFSKLISNSAKGLGLAGLALLLLDPETALDFISEAIGIFNDAMTAVSDLMMHSTEGIENFIDKNPMTSIAAGLFLITKGIGVVGGIIASIGGSITSIVAAFTTISGYLAPVLTTVLPLVATVGAIAWSIKSMYDAFLVAQQTFTETDSLMRSFEVFLAEFMSNLIGVPMNFLRDSLVYISDKFSLNLLSEELEQIDFQSALREVYQNGIEVIKNKAQELMLWFAEMPARIMSSIKTSAKEMFVSVAGVNMGTKLYNSLFSESTETNDRRFRVTTVTGEQRGLTLNEITQGRADGTIPQSEVVRISRLRNNMTQSMSNTIANSDQTNSSIVANSEQSDKVLVNTTQGFKLLSGQEIIRGYDQGTIKSINAKNALDKLKTQTTAGAEYVTTQSENLKLSSIESATQAASIAVINNGGGGSAPTNVQSNTTNITNKVSPDNISREYSFKPA